MKLWCTKKLCHFLGTPCRCSKKYYMGFVESLILFPAAKEFENWLRSHKVSYCRALVVSLFVAWFTFCVP